MSQNSIKANVLLYAVRYPLYNLKNAKDTRGGVLLIVKLQAKSFTKSNTFLWVFFTSFKLYKSY